MTIEFYVIKIFFLTFLSFIVAIGWTPLLTYFLYKYKLGKQIRTSNKAPIYSQLHENKSGTPVMGGLLVWVTVLVFAVVFHYLGVWFGGEFSKFDFLSRSQTWLPLGALVATAFVGLIDDFLNVKKIGPYGGGLSIKHRLMVYTVISLVVAWWFYFKLDWDFIRIPFLATYNIGLWFFPFVFFFVVGTAFSVNETDGLDGLAGGAVMAGFFLFCKISV